jgi:CubicO group peptidase (beta-lactamase class C family)
MRIRTAWQQSVDNPPIDGFVASEFHAVREEFSRNFSERGERGAACAVYYRGTKVVDLWGGYRCLVTREPWTQDTLVLVFSVTKGMAAAAMTVAFARGLFKLDEQVAVYWPEFAKSGKGDITVRQLLAHQAGLVALDQKIDAEILGDRDRLAKILARQSPVWRPGSRHGYHTLTLGWYQSELLRRVDPQHRGLGQFFLEEIARPLGVEFYIGLPAEIPERRLAVVPGYTLTAALRNVSALPLRFVIAGIWPQSLVARSVRCLGLKNPSQMGDREYRVLEIPAANGIGQARALARVYDALARGGRELGLTPGTLDELHGAAQVPTTGTDDAVLKIDTRYKLGFSRPSRGMSFGASSSAFGCPGAGGSFAMGDPQAGLGFAYVTNQMGFQLFDDPREKAVRDACYRSLSALRADHTHGCTTGVATSAVDGHCDIILESPEKQVGKNSCSISENNAGFSKFGA